MLQGKSRSQTEQLAHRSSSPITAHLAHRSSLPLAFLKKHVILKHKSTEHIEFSSQTKTLIAFLSSVICEPLESLEAPAKPKETASQKAVKALQTS